MGGMTMSEDFKELEARLRARKDYRCDDNDNIYALPDVQSIEAAIAIATLRAERDAARFHCDAAWDDIAELQRALNTTEWRDIATAPKDGTKILTFAPCAEDKIAVRSKNCGLSNWWPYGGSGGVICTYWMPLPPAPAIP
jgi:hypothetical protein